MRVSVIGCGYLGAVHAAAMAELGHEVVGIDVDERKIAALAAGRPPFFEPGLPEILTSATASGRLRFSTDIADAADAEVHFLAVGTPQAAGSNAADLRYVDAAFEGLLPHLADGALVVGKSTVPVGTAARLAARLAEAAPHASPRLEPRVPARGLRREGHARARSARVRRRRRARGIRARSRVPRGDRGGHAAHRHRLRHRRAREGRGERVPRHEDQLHQRDVRDRRCDRCGCHGARRRHRARRADRPAVPERGRGLRRRMPAEGHPGVHRARRGTRPRRVARVPQGGRRDQPAAAAARGRPAPSRRSAGPCSASASPCSASRSSPTPTTCATRRRSTWPSRSPGSARRSSRPTPRASRTRGCVIRSSCTRRRRRRRCAAPSSWCS